jgi:hypothetical protein
MRSLARAVGPKTAVWLASKEISDSTAQLRECMMRKFMESRSRPDIRMIEQTIVCLQELEKTGNLTPNQKAQLDSLLYEHALMLAEPKRESGIVSAA